MTSNGDGVEPFATGTAAGPLHVLIVENHPETRRSVATFLRVLGHRSEGVESVAAALALTAQTRFDVLLSDLRLPDGDGWDLLRQLAARGCCPAHAIAMSGLGSPSDHARSREAGFETLLVKPFAPEDLVAALDRATPRANLPGRVHPVPVIPGLVEAPSSIDWPQRLHDHLCQQLAAAALWQGILIRRLETMPESAIPGPLADALREAAQVARLLDDSLTETRALMREMREGDQATLGL